MHEQRSVLRRLRERRLHRRLSCKHESRSPRRGRSAALQRCPTRRASRADLDEVESYLGLVPSEDTTGGKRRLGAITKHGNTYLRALLVQSAWSILRQPVHGSAGRHVVDGRAGGGLGKANCNTAFPEHVHGGGEEFFVLQGLIVDDDGEYPVGAYVRNPVGSKHAPRAGADGATLLVKLHQFSAGDVNRVVVQTATTRWLPGSVSGLSAQK
jgi:hypothetical protein